MSQVISGVVVREPSTPWVSQEALAGILPSLATLGLPKNVTDRLIQSAEVLSQITGTTSNNEQVGEPGLIQYQMNGWQQETITFHWKDCKNLKNIRIGTKVRLTTMTNTKSMLHQFMFILILFLKYHIFFSQIIFDIHQVRRNRELVAANIRAHDDVDSDGESTPAGNAVGSLHGLAHPSGLSFHQFAGAMSVSPSNMHSQLVPTGKCSPTPGNRPHSASSSPPDPRSEAMSGLAAGISSYLANGMEKFSKQHMMSHEIGIAMLLP